MNEFIKSLPLTVKEKEELQLAYERRVSTYWVSAREEIPPLCEARKEERKARTIKRLLTDEPVDSIFPIPDVLKDYAFKLRSLGYSQQAISKGFKGAISTSWCITNLKEEVKRPRGQVIELLEDFERDFDAKEWLLLGSYNTQHGKKITEKEKKQLKDMYAQGWSIGRIAEVMKRSPSAVRRWIKK